MQPRLWLAPLAPGRVRGSSIRVRTRVCSPAAEQHRAVRAAPQTFGLRRFDLAYRDAFLGLLLREQRFTFGDIGEVLLLAASCISLVRTFSPSERNLRCVDFVRHLRPGRTRTRVLVGDAGGSQLLARGLCCAPGRDDGEGEGERG